VSERLLTRREAAARLGVSYDFICELIKARRIAVVQIGLTKRQPAIRIREEDLEAFIADRTVPAKQIPVAPSKPRPSVLDLPGATRFLS